MERKYKTAHFNRNCLIAERKGRFLPSLFGLNNRDHPHISVDGTDGTEPFNYPRRNYLLGTTSAKVNESHILSYGMV
jgi:hypothetical protein